MAADIQEWLRKLLVTSYWLLATGYWLLATCLLVTGYWLLATGYWLLATGYWLLATGLRHLPGANVVLGALAPLLAAKPRSKAGPGGRDDVIHCSSSSTCW